MSSAFSYEDAIKPVAPEPVGFSYEDAQPGAKKPEKPAVTNVLGTLAEGAKSSARAVGAAFDTYTDDADEVVAAAGAQKAAPKHASLERFYQDIEARKEGLGDDPGLWDSVKAVGGAVIDNPGGAGHALVEQLPNSAVSLGGAYAGMKSGAAAGSKIGGVRGGAVGGVLGGIAGMFAGNTAIETGFKAMEAADDGAFTPEERGQVMREGAVKGGVITGVDVATLGASKWILGATGRAMASAAEVATRKALTDAGVDVTNRAVVQAAAQNPVISAAVNQAQASAREAARLATDTFAKKAVRMGAAGALETAGEGLGEYLGELAATGRADMVDAVLESVLSLGQSGAEMAWSMAKNRDAIAEQQQPPGAPPVAAGPAIPPADPAPAGPQQGAIDRMTQLGALPQRTPAEERELSALRTQSTLDPNAGPLSRAASRANGEEIINAAQSSADEMTMRLQAANALLSVDALQQVRAEMGPDAARDLMQAYHIARNPALDDVSRRRALHDVEAFWQSAEQNRADQAAEFSEFLTQEATDLTQRLSAPAWQEMKGVDAGFDPANRLRNQVPEDPRGSFSQLSEFSDFVDSERQDLAQRRTEAIERRRQEALRAEVELADADIRTLAADKQAAAANRLAVLESVLADPTTVNPLGRFAAELRRQGMRNARPNEKEIALVERFSAAQQAFSQQVDQEIVQVAPNELDPYRAPGAPAAPVAPAAGRDKIAEFGGLMAQGWKIQNRSLVGPRGQKRNLNAAEFAAAREAGAQRAQQLIQGAQQNGPQAAQAVQGQPPEAQAPAARKSRYKPDVALTTRATPVRDDLLAMSQDAGWAEIGGRLLRYPNGDISRTEWKAHVPWFRAGMEINPDVLRQHVADVLAGRGAPVKSRRTIEGMLEWLQAQRDRAAQDPDASMYDFEEAFGDVIEDENARVVAEWLDDAQDAMSEADAMRALGFTEQEIANATGQQAQASARGVEATDAGTAASPGERGGETGQAQAQAGSQEGLTLDSYTPAELARRDAEQAASDAAEAKAQRDAEEKVRLQAERDEIRQRSEAAASTFTLGGDAMDNLSGQGGLFDAPAAPDSDVIDASAKDREQQAEITRFLEKDEGWTTQGGLVQKSLADTRKDKDGKLQPTTVVLRLKNGMAVLHAGWEAIASYPIPVNSQPSLIARRISQLADDWQVKKAQELLSTSGGAAANPVSPPAQTPDPKAIDQAIKILLDRTDGNGSPDGMNGPENLAARTEVVSLLGGRSVADLTADPRHKFITSVAQMENLLHSAAGITGDTLAARRTAFLDWIDARQTTNQPGGTTNADQRVDESPADAPQGVAAPAGGTTQAQQQAGDIFAQYQRELIGAESKAQQGRIRARQDREAQLALEKMGLSPEVFEGSEDVRASVFVGDLKVSAVAWKKIDKSVFYRIQDKNGNIVESESMGRLEGLPVHAALLAGVERAQAASAADGPAPAKPDPIRDIGEKIGEKRGQGATVPEVQAGQSARSSPAQPQAQQGQQPDILADTKAGRDQRAMNDYNAPQAVELDLRAKSRDTEQDGDVGVVMGNGDVRFVSLADAAAAARDVIAKGTEPTPFQIHNATGIRIGDAERVIREAQARQSGPQPLTSAPFASFEQMKTTLKVVGDVDALKERLRDLSITAFPGGKGAVSVPSKARWDDVRANIPVRIEQYRIAGVPDRLADVTIEVMESGAVVLKSPVEVSKAPSIEAAIARYVESYSKKENQQQARQEQPDAQPKGALPPGVTTRRITIDDNPAVEVTLPSGKVHRIQRVAGAGSMALTGWHDADMDLKGYSYLGDTQQLAIAELIDREKRASDTKPAGEQSKRPKLGEEGYTLEMAEEDLAAIRKANKDQYVSDARMLDKQRDFEKLVQEMRFERGLGGGFKAGDAVRVRGQDNKIRYVDQIGEDGWVFLKDGAGFRPEQVRELLYKSEPTPDKGVFPVYDRQPEAAQQDKAPDQTGNRRKLAEVIDNGGTNPGEYIVRDAGTNLARFEIGQSGRPVKIKYFQEAQATRDVAREAMDAFIADRAASSQPEAAPFFVVRPDGQGNFPVWSLEEARDKTVAFIEKTGLDADRVGAGVQVFDQKTGQPVARISSSGRIIPTETREQAKKRSEEAVAKINQADISPDNALKTKPDRNAIDRGTGVSFYENDVRNAEIDLRQTIYEEQRSPDFAPSELPKAVEYAAKDSNVTVEDLRYALLRGIDGDDRFSEGRRKQIREAFRKAMFGGAPDANSQPEAKPVSAADILKDAGLTITATKTRNGNDVWEVKGNTREHSETLKRLGGRWYGPKKAWSFYDADPSAKIAEAISLQAVPTEQSGTKKTASAESSHHAAGAADFKAGKPRILPSYYTDGKGKNARDWYRGWDAANLESPAQDGGTPQAEVESKPARVSAPAWDAATPAERRAMLSSVGYTDADQARALSGFQWADLSDTVRKALDKPASVRKPVTPQVLTTSQFNSAIQVAADSIDKLRAVDVDRVITETPATHRLDMANRIKAARPDLAAVVDAIMGDSTPSPVPAPAETTNPTSLDDMRADLQAGKRVHFDYAGADGRTLWIEGAGAGKGFVVKSMDDGNSTAWAKGGDPRRGGFSKDEAIAAALADAEYRFTQWKPLAEQQGEVDQILADKVKALTDNGVEQSQIDKAVAEYKEGDISLLDDLLVINVVRDKPERNDNPTDDEIAAAFKKRLAERMAAQDKPKAPRKPRAKATGDKPATAPAAPRTRTAGQAAKSAAKNTFEGIAEFGDALGKLFGGNGRLSSGLSFDEETYAKAKPIFTAAYQKFKAAGADLLEVVERLVDYVFDSFGPHAAANMEPYVTQFVKDARDGKIDYSENVGSKEQANDSADAVNTPTLDRPVAEGQRPGTGESTVRGAKQPRDGDGRTDGADVRGQGGRTDGGPNAPQGVGNAGGLSGVRDGATDGMAGSDGRVSADFRPERGGLTREGSWYDSAKRNVDLIELALQIEQEGRNATPAEQALLSKYVGFGASEIRNKLFPVPNAYAKQADPERLIWPNLIYEARWKELAERMDKLPREWQKSVLQSTQYAHYTSEGIIRSIWSAAQKLGFTGGTVLEPGAGIGSFSMLMPEAVKSTSRYTGIEFDGPTALIGRLLSPNQNLMHADFIKRKFPKNFFDVAVGNPPFSQTKIFGDSAYAKQGFMLHDFFFAKSIDLIRPGGLQIFVTSKGTMDKQSDKARKYLSERADLIGAIRLPSTAFEGNAGTSVVTDVIFLRKRLPGEAPAGQAWNALENVATPDGPVLINEYYAKHPEMVLGQNRISGNTDDAGRRINSNGMGGEKYTVVSYDATPAELDAKFAAAIERLPENVYSPLAQSDSSVKAETTKVDFDPSVMREGVLYVGKDGSVMRVTEGVGQPLDAAMKLSDKDKAWLSGYVALRDTVKEAQLAQATDGNWEAALKKLNKAYDAFRKEHGPILDFRVQSRETTDEDGNPVTNEWRVFKNRRLYREDYDASIVTALEAINEAGEVVKAPFLLGRTIGNRAEREVKSIGDALAVSLDSLGVLDIDDIARRIGISRDEAIDALGSQIYQTPDGQWQSADEYLSGNVVEKLAEAKEAAKINPDLRRNVEALTAAQPEKLGPSQISVKLGASWVPAEYVSEFAGEINAGKVSFDHLTESWQVSGGNMRSGRSASEEYGTAARSPSELLEAALNSRVIKVTEKKDGKIVTDESATTAANEVIKKIKDKFKAWIWTDSDRATALVESYNERFNNIAGRRFDGSHLTLPGVSLRFKLHPHQLRAIWRIIQTGNTYLAHAVGAGKTIEMIAAGMEQKRLGLIKKPMYVVPNHMLEQFSNEFMELYPLANIMVADDQNFSAERRRAFVANATMNNPDAIIITHDAFQRIGVNESSVGPIRDEILDDLHAALAEAAKDNDSRIRRSQLQQQIEAVTQRFDKIINAAGKDSTIKFEDIGADFLFVDEAHAHRKLDFHTGQKIKGIDPNGSKRALDMYVKTRWLESQNPGRSMVFASGTPVTNTMGELYTVMRFFAAEELERSGISTFDGWSRQFAEAVSALEPNAAGKYEMVERFAKFDNVPELMSRVRQFMDVLTSESLGALVKRPDLVGGKPNLHIVEPTDALEQYMTNELARRIEVSKAWKPSPDQPGNPDPIVNIITDGRLAALDPRFFGHALKKGETSLLTEMGDRIVAAFKATAKNVYLDKDGKPEKIKGSTQIVFYNLGFGEQTQARRGFNARAALTKILTDGGVPRDQIAWFDDANTDAKKEAIFKDMRSGKVRILIGSAKKMGTGVNVQKRLSHLHYQDPPWYPADVEQPHGRIIRQGNQNSEVAIDWYTTKGTYQSTMWQMVGRKQRFIDQAFTGDKSIRSMDDLGEASLFEQAAAVASGDPRALQLAGLKQDVERLERQQAAHASEQINAKRERERQTWYVESRERQIKTLTEAYKALGERYVSFVPSKVGNTEYDKQGEFGQAIKAAFNELASAEGGAPKDGKVIGTMTDAVSIEVAPEITRNKERTGRNELRLKIAGMQIPVMTEAALGDDIDAVGLTRRIVNAINGVESDLRNARAALIEAQTEITKLNKKIGSPFAYQQEMAEKYGELKQLEETLRQEGQQKPQPPAQQKANEAESTYTANEPLNQPDIDNLLDESDPYGNIDTRPGTREAQRDAGRDAMRALRRRLFGMRGEGQDRTGGSEATVLGATLHAGFKAGEANALTGQRIESPADLAALAQVYRDPRFETFRAIYVKNGKVVGEAGYSSRLPAVVALPKDMSEQIRTDLDRFGADGYYMLHNHPSGNASPSDPDVELTKKTERDVAGFLGHVVIDHNEYAVIRGGGKVQKFSAPELAATDYRENPAVKHMLLRAAVTNPRQVVQLGKALQIKGGHATLVLMSGERTNLIVDVPTSMLQTVDKASITRMKAVMRRMARESGSGHHRFMILPEGANIASFAALVTDGVVTDVVSADGRSLREQGTPYYGDFLNENIPVKRVAEEGSPYSADAKNEGSFRDTERAYGGREAYERAKAAGRTKLNYRQWAQVRTPNFKAWFGDWENDPANASKVTDPETGEPMVDAEGRPLFSRPDLVASRKAAIFEGGVDSGASDAKPIADLLVSKAFRLKGLGGLEIPAQRKVLNGVLALGDDLKILRSVVDLVPVDVMNILERKNLSPETLFRDEAVLKELLSADRDGSVTMAIDIADALVSAVARMAAEGSPVDAGMTAPSGKRNSASRAGVDDSFHDPIVGQIKATGNTGDFDGTNPNITAQRPFNVNDFADLSAEQVSLLSKIGAPDVRTTLKGWVAEKMDRGMTKIRQGLVDRYASLKDLDAQALGENFIESDITSSAWVLSKMASGAMGAMSSMLQTGRLVFNPQQRLIGMQDNDDTGGLVKVLQGLGGGGAEVSRFFAWMAANRSQAIIDRHKRAVARTEEAKRELKNIKDMQALPGKTTKEVSELAEARAGWEAIIAREAPNLDVTERLFTQEEVTAGMKLNEGTTLDGADRATVYAQTFATFQKYRDDVVAIAEATGVISAEDRAMWKDEFYVPFYRVMAEEAVSGPTQTKGLSRQEAYKKLKGGKENLNDLLQNTLMNFNHLLTASLKNQAAAQAMQNAVKVGIARETTAQAASGAKNVTYVLQNGQRVFYEIDDPLVFESLTALSNPGINSTAVRVMAAFKRFFTNMTTVTPQFVIANTIRDLMQASATSPASKNVFKNFAQGVTQYRDEETRAKMLASGGAFSFGHLYGSDMNEVQASLQREMRNANLITSASMVPGLLKAGWRKWADVTDAAENISRTAVFMQNQDKGVLRAAFEARDVMDFSQHGAWPAVQFLIRVVPFLNARLQGLDKLYRSGGKPLVLTAMGKGTDGDKANAARFSIVTGTLALASIMLYLANADDEEYQKLEDWQKDSYWFFRIGENAYFLPKPFEVGAISTMAERMAEQFLDDKASGRLFRERMWAMLTQTFAFSPVPQMFQPALDVYSNVDAFTKRDIETTGMDRLSPGLRARDTTTVVAHGLSAVTRAFGDNSPVALSPVQVDHLIKGYLGAVGATAAGMTDVIWRSANGEVAPEKHWSEYQPIRRFYRDLGIPEANNRYGTLFYEGLRETNRIYADVRELQKMGRHEDAASLSERHAGKLSMRIELNRAQRDLTGINQRMRQVRSMTDVDSTWKRRELDLLRIRRTQITNRFGKRIEAERAA